MIKYLDLNNVDWLFNTRNLRTIFIIDQNPMKTDIYLLINIKYCVIKNFFENINDLILYVYPFFTY